MTKFTGLVFVLSLLVISSVSATPDDKERREPTTMTAERWEMFSQNLVRALASGNDGVQQAALRMIIQHADFVQVDEALPDIVRIYQTSNDEALRRMAVVTLGKVQSEWAIEYLRRAERFEKSPVLRNQIRAVLAQHKLANATR
jgi:hypothetical protein